MSKRSTENHQPVGDAGNTGPVFEERVAIVVVQIVDRGQRLAMTRVGVKAILKMPGPARRLV